MTCQRCHAENPEGSRFCHACGAPLAVPAANAPAAAAVPSPPPAPVAPNAPTPATVQPPLRQHVSHTGKAAIIGFALAGILGVFIMAGAALSFVRPAVHPGATGGGIKPPVIQPAPAAPGTNPLAPLAPGPVVPAPAPPPSAPGSAPVAPSVPAAPAPPAPGGTAPVAPAAPEPVAPAPAAPTTPTLSAPSNPASPRPAAPAPAAPRPAAPAPSPTQPNAAPQKPAKPTANPAAPPAGVPPLVRPAAPVAPAPRRPQMPSTSGPALHLQRYRSPSGLYAIGYPQGWQMKEDPNQNAVVFFKDDADEGTSFGMAMQPLQGRVSARQILAQFIASFQRQYPDATATVLSNSRADGDDTLSADAAWTGATRQAMRAWIVIRTWTPPGSIRPWFVLMGGQAPAPAFRPMLPTFAEMVRTLIF